MMPDKLEKLIRSIYRKYKASRNLQPGQHPDEETMACFIEARLSPEEEGRVKQHLTECNSCAEAFVTAVKLDMDSQPAAIAEGLISKAKGAFMEKLEIFLKAKEDLMELLSTNGDVLVGQELVPAPVLRSRQVKGFKDEVLILKDFAGIRVEIKIEKGPAPVFSLSVNVKDKQNLQVIKDLRITLLKGDLELESYINDSGRVVFEHLALGKYTVEIVDIQEKLAAILVDIRS